MSDVTDATFEAEVLKSEIPVLVDFWAPWCGPCKSMLPIVEEVSKDYEGKVKVVKVNVDENTDVPQKFGVMSIPAFFVFKDGEAAANFVGVKTKEFIGGELDKVIGG
jgi:thioredoxin 1